jgi:hypothetical protein
MLIENSINHDDEEDDKVSCDRQRKTRAILKKMRERE